MRAVSRASIAAALAAAFLAFSGVAQTSPAAAAMGGRPGMTFPHGGGGFHGRGGGFGRGAGFGFVGGLATGAIIGSTVAPYSYYDDSGCYQYRPAYDQWGNFLGQQLVNVCGY